MLLVVVERLEVVVVEEQRVSGWCDGALAMDCLLEADDTCSWKQTDSCSASSEGERSFNHHDNHRRFWRWLLWSRMRATIRASSGVEQRGNGVERGAPINRFSAGVLATLAGVP